MTELSSRFLTSMTNYSSFSIIVVIKSAEDGLALRQSPDQLGELPAQQASIALDQMLTVMHPLLQKLDFANLPSQVRSFNRRKIVDKVVDLAHSV